MRLLCYISRYTQSAKNSAFYDGDVFFFLLLHVQITWRSSSLTLKPLPGWTSSGLVYFVPLCCAFHFLWNLWFDDVGELRPFTCKFFFLEMQSCWSFFIRTPPPPPPSKLTGIRTLKFLSAPLKIKSEEFVLCQHLWKICSKGKNSVRCFEEKIWSPCSKTHYP